ncbi:hypothetical protein DASC09_063940 [Saccharomycopsis crataegensis]|uniref:Uncharacterized protein n=1 Tax=Saccharomycopsis crataegensis TaxID=43959 RepID=A0AAV5QVS8_9ASCO|nr:hypothetical protein DASC09_063940 [Saccharomycopsis crataegensis]
MFSYSLNGVSVKSFSPTGYVKPSAIKAGAAEKLVVICRYLNYVVRALDIVYLEDYYLKANFFRSLVIFPISEEVNFLVGN